MNFDKIAYKFLVSSGIKISKNYLKERLESHPHYPTLNALTDILDEFKIENHALKINQKDKLKELDFPFMAHVVYSDGIMSFELIKSRKQIGQTKEFFKRWTNIVLVLGNQRKFTHKEHDEQYKKEKLNKRITLCLLTSLIMLLAVNQILSFNFFLFFHFIFALVGFGFSCVIIARGLGLRTDISELFCKVEETGCNKVLNSRLGHFAGNIGLGDMAGIFFGSLILYLSFSIHLNFYENLTILLMVQSIAVLFTFISIIYQWIIGSWCNLCFAIISVLWILAANLVWQFYELAPQSLHIVMPSLKSYLILGMSLLFTSLWIIVKPLILANRTIIHQNIRIRKWRQDPNWFNALLPLHKRIDDSIWDKEIFYGNTSGVLQIIVVSDPYCEYCARAHHELDEILKKHPNDIGIRVRFALKSNDPQSEKYIAVHKILNAYEEMVWKHGLSNGSKTANAIITNWFHYNDIVVWSESYNFPERNGAAVDKLIQKSMDWSLSMQINQTPAFFVNGHEMPNPHTFKDLFLFVSEYIAILHKNELNICKSGKLVDDISEKLPIAIKN